MKLSISILFGLMLLSLIGNAQCLDTDVELVMDKVFSSNTFTDLNWQAGFTQAAGTKLYATAAVQAAALVCDGSSTPPAPTTCTDPSASNFGGALPCTYAPTTCTDPSASNFGGPLPCTYAPTTCTDPSASNFGGPLPCTYAPTTCTDPSASNFGGPLPCTYAPTMCTDPSASNFMMMGPCSY